MDGLVYRTTDNSKWGAGKDARLTSDEEDNNKWVFEQAIDDLTNNPPTAVSIANFNVVGSQFQVVLTNGATLGPFQLPYASFKFRQEGYVDGGSYHELDLIPVANKGLFMVESDFTASGPFDPFAVDGDGNPLYTQLFGTDMTIADVPVSIIGKPGDGADDGDPIWQFIAVRNICWLSSEIATSIAKLAVAPDDDLTLSVCKNDIEIATITFSSGQTTSTLGMTDDVQFAAGDILSITKPDVVNDTAKHLVATFALRSGLLADFGIT